MTPGVSAAPAAWRVTADLYDHQLRAVEKLRRVRVGGLFMEMGTGKTAAALELVWLRRERIDRVAWFCPVSLKETIRQEILRHTTGATVYVFNDRTTAENLPDALFYVVGIESMSSSTRVALAVRALITERSFVIVDESSYIKGYNSRRTIRITALAEPSRYRLLLTGTPISQGVVDLFAQMKFLSPKILGYRSFASFAARHLEYSLEQPGRIIATHDTAYLAARLAPYTYQITKAECLDLPSKLYERRYCYLTIEQRQAYEQAKVEILCLMEEKGEFDPYILFQLFGVLQQIVCGFWNYRVAVSGPAGDAQADVVKRLTFPNERLDTLLAALDDVPAGEKVIIWAKYHYCIGQIVAALRNAYGDELVAEFHGRLSERQRNAELDRWRANTRFLVATQAAGGHGLTLNEAHHVVFYADDFNYATRRQAEDRCHRIGQTRPVTYIEIICADSIDERIVAALARKANAAEEFRRKVADVKDDFALVKRMVQAL